MHSVNLEGDDHLTLGFSDKKHMPGGELLPKLWYIHDGSVFSR